MKKALLTLLLSLALCLSNSLLGQKTCPTTAVDNKSRTLMKHKKPSESIRATRTSVVEMVNWPDPANLTIAKVSEPAQLIAIKGATDQNSRLTSAGAFGDEE